MADVRFVTKENMKTIVAGLGDKFEAKDATIVKDAAYVHTDSNFTAALLAKLNGIEANAEVNAVEGVQVNGTDITPDAAGKVNITAAEGDANGTVKVNGINVAVHGLGTAAYRDESEVGDANVIEAIKVGTNTATVTNKTVELGTAAGADVAATLANDATIPTGAAVQTYVSGLGYQTAQDVATAIAAVQHITMSVVATLPQAGETNVIYLVPDDDGGDNKDMYIWDATEGEFVLVGNMGVDLTDYVRLTDLGGLTTAEVEEVLA